MTEVNTINFLNAREFRINKDMLEFAILEWKNENRESYLFGHYNKLHPKTELLNGDRVDEDLDYQEIISHNSKYWSYYNVLNIAILMKDTPLYFPTFMDFRGRIYPTPNYLSYQGGDLARSLIEFANVNEIQNIDSIIKYTLTEEKADIDKYNKKVKLQSLDYVKLYLGNIYGLDKQIRSDRIKWVNDNIKDMFELYENDFQNFLDKYLKNSKEPAQFMSCFIALYNHLKFNTQIKIPILLDASCSGIQHLSALTTDSKLAKLCNVLHEDEDTDKNADFYSYCIDLINGLIQEMDENFFKQNLLKLKIIRKWLKHPIMTVSYNVSISGIKEKISERTYFEKEFISFKDAYVLADKGLLSSLEIKEIQFKKGSPSSSENKLINNEEGELVKGEKKDKDGFYIYRVKNIILKDQFQNSEVIFTGRSLMKFSKIIKDTVYQVVPAYKNLKSYFDQIINIMENLNAKIF